VRQTAGGTVAYFATDHLGSTRALTDASGNSTPSVGYDSFGNVTSGSSQSRYAYTGRELESETSLLYYRARWYDPHQGRFVSEDPIGFEGGIHFYAYVGGSPMSFRDPLGLQMQPYERITQSGSHMGPIRGPNPHTCQPGTCFEKCLEKIFGPLPPINVFPNAKSIATSFGYAISGYRTVQLPVSCDEFFDDPWWVLHEYYHVVRQWEPGSIAFGLRYLGQAVRARGNHDAIPAEQEADKFAKEMLPGMKDCLKYCKPCY
jgi:RHS repeat-associated protein